MFYKNKINTIKVNCRFLFVVCAVLGSLFLTNIVLGQTAKPTPTPEEVELGGYQVTSSIELGVRGKSLTGNDNKFRSDFNYKPGFRVFNSSFSLESKEGTKKVFDSLLVNSSGWGADPSGFTRVNVEKAGSYTFNANVRRVGYFNSLNNYALNQHNQNTSNNMGDFDLRVTPIGEKLALNFGYSYSRYKGPGLWTFRANSDEFAVPVSNDNTSNDFRAGIEAKVLGFNLGFTQGYRFFKDNLKYELLSPSAGNNTTNNSRTDTFLRDHPTRGEAFFSVFDIHRTFAKTLDLTGKLVYSTTISKANVTENLTGRDNSNNIVVSDYNFFQATAKRPQTRGDLGLTYLANDHFKLSNSFTFDQFAVNGGDYYYRLLKTTTSAGVPRADSLTDRFYYRVTYYRRFSNTVEGDIQINNAVALHLGYRFTKRKAEFTSWDINKLSTTNPTAPTVHDEENSTNTLIAGMKIKPTKNWVIFWDTEHGEADNVFTRVENYKFTNFRFRNRLTFNKFALNLSAILKDNTNPTVSTTGITFGVNSKSRIYSGSVDWNPIPELSFNSGYTYTHQTSFADVVVPVGVSGNPKGFSQFFVRDNYAFFDVVANPVKRLSLFASYRISKDTGQGNLVAPFAYTFVNSYPYQLQSPEFRAAIRLTKNIDWNIGYQYYNYKEKLQFGQTLAQNYKTHLPYTSLTIYFGGADR